MGAEQLLPCGAFCGTACSAAACLLCGPARAAGHAGRVAAVPPSTSLLLPLPCSCCRLLPLQDPVAALLARPSLASNVSRLSHLSLW